ncbi:uncharacterized protein LOC142230515 [Haematobia irritans]|uniref:uncharacterized protein LOC142230515 n=1 Tax=Haematobia irritans TaxID=7368 RepID=UPI003F50AAA4
MYAKKYNSLQYLCRACLQTVNKDSVKDNGLLASDLGELFLHCTTMDVSKEANNFPKLLCDFCMIKLREYDEFRKLTMKSTASLYEMLNDRNDKKEEIQCPDNAFVKTENFSDDDQMSSEKRDAANYVPENENSVGFVKTENFSDDDQMSSEKRDAANYVPENEDSVGLQDDSENDDDKLLLPELANLPLNIKSEPYYEATDFNQESYTNDNDNSVYRNNYIEHDDMRNSHSPSKNVDNLNMSKSTSPSKQDRNHKKSVYCKFCNKQFYKEFYLDAHIRGVHMGEKEPYRCVLCFKSFTGYNQLYLHKRSKHGKVSKEVIKSKMSQMMKLYEIKSSSTADNVTKKFNNPRNTDWERNGGFTCHTCMRNYSSKRALSEHMKRHKQIKEHICRICGVAKVTRTELLTHMRVHEPNAEKFPCPKCPQVFNHKNAISRHVKVIHEGQRRFACSYCPKRFTTRNTQIAHERLHTGERPYSCTICHKSFVQKDSLRSHIKNHEKNHICRYCSRRFITLKNLVDHEKRHFGEKPHICNWCSKGFRTSEDLEAHRKTCTTNEDDQSDCNFSEVDRRSDSDTQNSQNSL